MIRKLFLFATFLLTLTGIKAQSVGDWKIWPRLSGDVSNIVETPSMVYYISDSRLASYNKDTNESLVYTSQNKLSDNDISFMRYNPDGRYLLVAYDNGNIDLLYDNGRVVNINDIKNATLTYSRGLNSVTFANGRIYVATNFGFVVIDDQKHEVVESGIFGIPVRTVFTAGDKMILHLYDNEKALYWAPLSGYRNTFDKFTKFADINAAWVLPLDNDGLILYRDYNNYRSTRGKIDTQTPSFSVLDMLAYNTTVRPEWSPEGYYLINPDNFVILNEDGTVKEAIKLPQILKDQTVLSYSGNKEAWASDTEGLARYKIDGDQVTVLTDKFHPYAITTDQVMFMRFDNDGNLWLGNQGPSQFRLGEANDNWWIAQATTKITDGRPEDVNLYNASAFESYISSYQVSHKNTRMYGGCGNFVIDPENTDRYFQTNGVEGLYIIENNEEIFKYRGGNYNGPEPYNDGLAHFPASGYGYKGVRNVEFDPEGNLWVGLWTGSGSISPYWILPKNVLRSKKPSEILASDWIGSKHVGVDAGNKDMVALFCQKSPVMFCFHGSNNCPIGVYKRNDGSWLDVGKHTYFELVNAVDQDGKAWKPVHLASMAEDKNGKVWFGASDGGVVVIDNPATFTENTPLNRIKVPRNDGTNYADYLCESDMVYGIAVDNSNRKWLATQASGVYLVSENGDEIIEHFTTDNSPLPSNEVFSVICDPNSNTVYFGLASGLVSYNSNSAPAADSYSDIYAYPNPVRPDYTGYITITGLKDNSLVKITDNTGAVVFQTRSEGGMAIWDGFDSKNQRAKSGVYYVFASEGADGGSEGAVTKIMIIR